MTIEAMKQWLEALENSVDLVIADAYNAEQLYGKYPSRQARVGGLKLLADKHQQAITSLREFIAEAEKQEPLTYLLRRQDRSGYETGEKTDYGAIPVYTHPQPKSEPLLVFAQECVLGAYRESELADAAQRAIEAAHGITSDMKQEPVAKTAKQRHEWVGLTDEDVDQGLLRSDYALQAAHAWRAGVVFAMTQLKEKNI
jgi:hypothetical protein